MDMLQVKQHYDRRSLSSRHIHALSQDTNASGIADSTISNGESVKLSQFPPPPSLIPNSPLQPNFSESQWKQSIPLVPLRRDPFRKHLSPNDVASTGSSVVAPSLVHSKTSSSEDMDVQSYSSSLKTAVSPHDWHEGASSIDVDATENRLLPTSFITSLLRENTNSRKVHRTSFSSDAVSGTSGISEMSYPPPYKNLNTDSQPAASPLSRPFKHHSSQRVVGARPPPSSFASGTHSNCRSSTHSKRDGPDSALRTASISRGVRVPGAAVVGVAPAILHAVGSKEPIRQIESQDPYDPAGTIRDSVDTTNIDYGIHRHSTSFSPSLPSIGTAGTTIGTAGTEQRLLVDYVPPSNNRRQSVQSSASLATTFLSRISSIRSIQRFFSRKETKALPPVPMIPHIPIATEARMRKEEESTPLPDLLNRAEVLHGMLESGHNPHHSIGSRFGSYDLSSSHDSDAWRTRRSETTNDLTSTLNGSDPVSQPTHTNSRKGPFWPFKNTKSVNDDWPSHKGTILQDLPQNRVKRRRILIILVSLLLLLAVIAIVVGVVVSRQHHHSNHCTGNFTGSLCNLDATCVCTSNSTSDCQPVAKAIIELLPTVNNIFDENLTMNSAFQHIWSTQAGLTTDKICTSQSNLIDVGPNLDPQQFPNRTGWARSAIFWNMVQSHNLTATESLQEFASTKAQWDTIKVNDGPMSDGSILTTIVNGFSFDFAAQKIVAPAVSFRDDANPTTAQLENLDSNTEKVLDNIVSNAVASSTQRHKALMDFWNNPSLQLNAKDLDNFLATLAASAILLPFDATSPDIISLHSNNATPDTFPPPISCYPDLSSLQIQQINAIENRIFGLGPATTTHGFNNSCFADRPVYGVLDILNLRLPFPDYLEGVAKQASVLHPDVNSRAVIYSGQVLSAYPSGQKVNNFTGTLDDPFSFGTSKHLDHVVLQFLSSITNTTLISTLVKFVLKSPSNHLPPDDTTALELAHSIPVLEVAVFGKITSADYISTASSFTTPSGELFFGSQAGTFLRNWSIPQRPIIWTEGATSQEIVRDESLSDINFSKTWQTASEALQNHQPGVLLNITTLLHEAGKFTPL